MDGGALEAAPSAGPESDGAPRGSLRRLLAAGLALHVAIAGLAVAATLVSPTEVAAAVRTLCAL